MKVLTKRQLNKAVCPPVVQGCVCEQKTDEFNLSFSVDSKSQRSYWFCAWNLGEEILEVHRYLECPDDWKPMMSCGKPLELSDDNPDEMFYLPGHYWLKLKSGNPFPDDFVYEKFPVTREMTSLYFDQKRACCCE